MGTNIYSDKAGKKFIVFHIESDKSIPALEKFVGGGVLDGIIPSRRKTVPFDIGDYVIYISNHPSGHLSIVPVELDGKIELFEPGTYLLCTPEEFHRNFEESLKWETSQ